VYSLSYAASEGGKKLVGEEKGKSPTRIFLVVPLFLAPDSKKKEKRKVKKEVHLLEHGER